MKHLLIPWGRFQTCRVRSPGRSLILIAAAGAIWATPDKGNSVRGKAVFETNCADCHDPESKEERVGPGLQGANFKRHPVDRVLGPFTYRRIKHQHHRRAVHRTLVFVPNDVTTSDSSVGPYRPT